MRKQPATTAIGLGIFIVVVFTAALFHAGIRAGLPLFGGNTAHFDLVTAATTLMVAIGGISLLYRRTKAIEQQLEISRRSEVAVRYQKGVELIASDNTAARVGGIHVLRDIAIEQPEIYARNCVDLLSAMMRHESREAMKFFKHVRQDIRFTSRSRDDLQDGLMDVNEAFLAVGEILSDKNATDVLFTQLPTKISITSVYIRDILVPKTKLSNIVFEDCFIDQAAFATTKISKCMFKRTCFGHVSFYCCAISDCDFSLIYSVNDGDEIEISGGEFLRNSVGKHSTLSPNFHIRHTNLEGCHIEGTFALVDHCWFDNEEPTFEGELASEDVKFEVYRWNAQCKYEQVALEGIFEPAQGQAPKITGKNIAPFQN